LSLALTCTAVTKLCGYWHLLE